MQGNSKEIEKGSGTGGSRSTPVGGSALKVATENLLKKIKELLSIKYNVEIKNIKYKNGLFLFYDKKFNLAETLSKLSNKGNIRGQAGSLGTSAGKLYLPKRHSHL